MKAESSISAALELTLHLTRNNAAFVRKYQFRLYNLQYPGNYDSISARKLGSFEHLSVL